MNRRRFLKRGLSAMVAAGCGSVGFAAAETRWVQVTQQKIAVPRLPEAFAGKTLVLLTDPHVGPFPFASVEFLRSTVARINALKPNIIALGGDYLYGKESRQFLEPCMRGLAELRAPLGVYAVLGNHDHLFGLSSRVHDALKDHGIVDVSNAGRWIETGGERLRLCGVDDLWFGRPNLTAALQDAQADSACLLLSHNPDYVETLSDPRVSLVLSGHLHGGQIMLPVLRRRYLPSRYGTKYLQGLVQGPWTQVFVSRGLGTVGLPMRFRCPPEINLLTLVKG